MQNLDNERQRKIDKLLSLSTRCLINKDRMLTSAAILKDLKEIRVSYIPDMFLIFNCSVK
jgi:hypothetical protein